MLKRYSLYPSPWGVNVDPARLVFSKYYERINTRGCFQKCCI